MSALTYSTPAMAAALRAPTNMTERAHMSAGLVAYDASKSLIEDGWIEEVLFPVKSGKEANVYCCRACPGRGYAFFALKVYKAPKHRSFRDAAVYQEGRVIANARTARAVRNKSRFGRAAEFGGWIHHEFAMLNLLHAPVLMCPAPSGRRATRY